MNKTLKRKLQQDVCLACMKELADEHNERPTQLKIQTYTSITGEPWCRYLRQQEGGNRNWGRQCSVTGTVHLKTHRDKEEEEEEEEEGKGESYIRTFWDTEKEEDSVYVLCCSIPHNDMSVKEKEMSIYGIHCRDIQ